MRFRPRIKFKGLSIPLSPITASWQLLKKPEVRARLLTTTSVFLMAGVLVFSTFTPVLAQPGGNNKNQKQQDEQIATEARELSEFVERANDYDLHDKHEYRKEVNDMRQGYWRHKPCHIIKKIDHLLKKVEHFRAKRPSPALEELYVKLWTLRADILASLPNGKRCGQSQIGVPPQTTLKTSDNQRVALDVSFGSPTLTTAIGNGQTFTRVHVPGVESMVGTVGEPAIPTWHTLIALPEGATPVLKAAQVSAGQELRVNLVPFQEQPVDQAQQIPGTNDIAPIAPPETFADKPFTQNEQTYKTNRLLPPNPCNVRLVGQYRDMQIAQLTCATAQYNPVSDQLRLHRSLSIEIAFEGSKTGTFINSHTLSPFENGQMVVDSVLNREAVSRYVKDLDISALQCSGEELLILTHANFRVAADDLAAHKKARGMATSVFNVGSGVASRDTAEEIDQFIEDRYDECKVRPSYVILMGDAEFIPTFYPADMPDNAGSDFPYSNYVQILFDAFFPDFAVGRIPVDTNAQAQTVVDKIKKYESDPPKLGLGNGAPFYTTAGFASQFQCCRMNANGTPLNNQPGTDQRAFIETSEIARQELVDRGYTVPRIYTRTVDNGGYCIQENAQGDCIQTQAAYSGNTTPRRYFNGTLLPGDLGAGSGFAWNGSTADVSNAWNEGRFLFLHRDHGWPGGWGDPGFSTDNVDALSNGDLLPVVMSVNCASGMFDNETAGGTYGTMTNGVYFAERALRKADGGAIGIIGDTRNSPTWANNALTRGFFDAVWTDTLPGEGPTKSQKRLGDIVNWGKIYLASQVSVPQSAGSVSVGDMGYEYHIWGLTGDPSLAMWTKNPYKLDLSLNFKVASSTARSEKLNYATEGATITKLQLNRDGSTTAIGRATVKGGIADMQYFQQPANANAQFVYAASMPDAVSVPLAQEQPPTGPRVN